MIDIQAPATSAGFDSSHHSDLIGRRPGFFALKLAVWAALIASGYALLMLATPWSGAFFVGLGLAALMTAHGVELEHQALHEMGFKSRTANRIWGFVLGLPMLISFSHYKDRHLHHHLHVGTPQDSEFFAYSKTGNQRPLGFLANVVMLPHWRSAAARILQAVVLRKSPPCFNTRNSRNIMQEYQAMGAVIAVLVVLSVTVYWKLLAFPILVALVAAPFHTLLELPEHAGCESVADIFRNTRSIGSNLFVTWLTNGNNFHVEHHLLPTVVPERLYQLHDRVRGQIVYRNRGYREFVAGLLFASKG